MLKVSLDLWEICTSVRVWLIQHSHPCKYFVINSSKSADQISQRLHTHFTLNTSISSLYLSCRISYSYKTLFKSLMMEFIKSQNCISVELWMYNLADL